MREILFRGKRWDNGAWVVGDLNQFQDRCIIHAYETGRRVAHSVNHDTVGQYTGIADKNGVRIFEGDIVIHNRSGYVIRYLPKYFRFAGVKSGCVFAAFIPAACEVIGNIHDNPELMERLEVGRHERETGEANQESGASVGGVRTSDGSV